MFSNVHDILRATVQLSFSCTLYPNILFRASAVAFPVDGLVCLWSVDSSVGLAIFSCDWALLLLSCSLFSVVQLCYLLCFNIRWGTANLMVDLKYYVTNNTLATLTLPSLFGKSSMIFPIFHDSFSTYVFIWNISPADIISFTSTSGDFKLICHLSRRLNR